MHTSLFKLDYYPQHPCILIEEYESIEKIYTIFPTSKHPELLLYQQPFINDQENSEMNQHEPRNENILDEEKKIKIIRIITLEIE